MHAIGRIVIKINISKKVDISAATTAATPKIDMLEFKRKLHERHSQFYVAMFEFGCLFFVGIRFKHSIRKNKPWPLQF